MSGNGDMTVHGGVKVDKNTVERLSTTKDSYGTEKFVIDFKSGVKAIYEKSENGYINSHILNVEGFEPETYTNVYSVMGLELKGTKYRDAINIKDSEVLNIDIKNGGKDFVGIKDSKGDLGESVLKAKADSWYNAAFGEVQKDKKDEVYVENSKYIDIREE